eukprot:2243833-Rhodomonas_salina.3
MLEAHISTRSSMCAAQRVRMQQLVLVLVGPTGTQAEPHAVRSVIRRHRRTSPPRSRTPQAPQPTDSSLLETSWMDPVQC